MEGALGPQPRIPNENKGCCVVHRCHDHPRTRSPPIGNPRSVFLHTRCPSTTSEVDPSLGLIYQGLDRLAVGPYRTLPQPWRLSLRLDESIKRNSQKILRVRSQPR
eukprot:1022545-Pyramimonas_sp.AAC.1